MQRQDQAPAALGIGGCDLQTIGWFMRFVAGIFDEHPEKLLSRIDLGVFLAMSRIGETEMIRRLLRSGSKLGIHFQDVVVRKTPTGWSMHHLACANGHTGTFRYLLAMCEMHTSGGEGTSAGRPRLTVDTILEDTTSQGYNVFHLAAVNGHNDTVSYLLNLTGSDGGDVRRWLTVETSDGNNVLHLMATGGRVGTIRHIMEHQRRRAVRSIGAIYAGDQNKKAACYVGAVDSVVETIEEYETATAGEPAERIDKSFVEYVEKLKVDIGPVRELAKALSEAGADPNAEELYRQHYDAVLYLSKCFREQYIPVPKVYDEVLGCSSQTE